MLCGGGDALRGLLDFVGLSGSMLLCGRREGGLGCSVVVRGALSQLTVPPAMSSSWLHGGEAMRARGVGIAACILASKRSCSLPCCLFFFLPRSPDMFVQ